LIDPSAVFVESDGTELCILRLSAVALSQTLFQVRMETPCEAIFEIWDLGLYALLLGAICGIVRLGAHCRASFAAEASGYNRNDNGRSTVLTCSVVEQIYDTNP
jgi:hypothetical protein